MRIPARWSVAAILVAATATLAACGDDTPVEPGLYVALGDSYTAGLGLEPQDGKPHCGRSLANYPRLVSEATGLRLVDVSCSGAKTADLVVEQEFGDFTTVPPQGNALSDVDPELITIGIGGNDHDISGLALSGCSALGVEDPDGTPCADADRAADFDMGERIVSMGVNLRAAFSELRSRFPDTTILAVGYPQVVPEDGVCRGQLPIARRDYPWARGLNEQIDQTIRSAAESADIGFVDIWTASADHTICSPEPWVNGQFKAKDGAAPFHPLPAFMTAVAELIEADL
ncbi:SGNH/GDSL hydrolase family protein [Nocardioides sp. R-C-SC26]|uniref:SGNH/GDSL hydrolase family protein n=1 Tax=Nocardioides sp. R-C-SC26 TaxID=2870414 RepID=UPI001E632BF4|nr:SGNH/GDSL hydrolase family protein [Nocardioides sp. R-C-SC26]